MSNIPPQPLLDPRVLTADQRYILRHLIERDGSPRSEALFALGYWAGCRVSDVSWLLMEQTHVGSKVGWLSCLQAATVMKEVLYAMQRKGDSDLALPEIIPVIIEGPPPVEPPPELAHLHFNDRLIYFMC